MTLACWESHKRLWLVGSHAVDSGLLGATQATLACWEQRRRLWLVGSHTGSCCESHGRLWLVGSHAGDSGFLGVTLAAVNCESHMGNSGLLVGSHAGNSGLLVVGSHTCRQHCCGSHAGDSVCCLNCNLSAALDVRLFQLPCAFFEGPSLS